MHDMHPFPCDIEAMIRRIKETDPGALNELGPEQWEWTKRRGLEQARERLRALLIRKGVNPRTIALKAVLLHSFFLVAAVFFFCSGALLWYLADNGMFVIDVGGGLMKWAYPLCGIIIGIPFLVRWIRNR